MKASSRLRAPRFSTSLIEPGMLPEVTLVRFDELERRGVEALAAAREKYPVVVLDEIGSLQLASRAFRRAIDDLVASHCILLATTTSVHDEFIERLRARSDCRSYEITTSNRTTMHEDVIEALFDALQTRNGNAVT